MVKQNKKPKEYYKIMIQIEDDYDIHEEYVLMNELNSDMMNDIISYYSWLYGDMKYKFISCEPYTPRDRNIDKVKHQTRNQVWRDFYSKYGDGEHLSIDYL